MKKKVLHKVLDGVGHTMNEMEREVDGLLEPVRKSVFSRFPVLFILLVTFGVVATLWGFEQVIVEIDFLHQRPLLVLSVGIGILTGTGTLYKKLG